MPKRIHHIKTALILVPVILMTGLVPQLPWWSFVVPVLITGAVIARMKWKVSCFFTGFIVGFVIWSGANIFFDIAYSGVFFDRLGSSVKWLFLLGSGIPGGLLTGMALYTGHAMITDNMHKFSL